jgi:hypothetical protein
MIWQVPLALAVVLAVGGGPRLLNEEIESGFAIRAYWDHDHAKEKRDPLVQYCDYR